MKHIFFNKLGGVPKKGHIVLMQFFYNVCYIFLYQHNLKTNFLSQYKTKNNCVFLCLRSTNNNCQKELCINLCTIFKQWAFNKYSLDIRLLFLNNVHWICKFNKMFHNISKTKIIKCKWKHSFKCIRVNPHPCFFFSFSF